MHVTSGPPSSGRSLPGAPGCPLQSLRVTRNQVHVLEDKEVKSGRRGRRRRSTKWTDAEGRGYMDQFAGAAGPRSENHGAAPLPGTPGPLRSACPGEASVQVHTNDLWPWPRGGLRGLFHCVSGNSNTFWGSPLRKPLNWAPRIHHDWSRQTPPASGAGWGTQPAPPPAADTDSARDADSASAGGPPAVSFVSNVLIVTDYMPPPPLTFVVRRD